MGAGFPGSLWDAQGPVVRVPVEFPRWAKQPQRAQPRSTKGISLGMVTPLQRKRITTSGLGTAIRDFRPKLGLLSPRPLPRSLECIFSPLLSSCFSTNHLNLPPSFYVCGRSSCFWKAGWNRHAIPPEISTCHAYCWPEVLRGPCCDRWCLVQAVSWQQQPGQCGRCGWWSQGGTGNLPSAIISHMSLLTTQGVPSHLLIF